MPKHLKKISEEILHENPWWKYKHDIYERPNGSEGDYFYAETPGVVMIVPVLPDGRIVLTLQHRYLVDKQSIEFPGGGIPEGMAPSEAAVQELLEETGCTAKEMVKIGEFEPDAGFVRDRCHVFLAHIISQSKQQLDETEEIELLYRLPEEVDDMIRKNEIWDGETMATWSLVYHYFNK
ncbi:MAG: NUDIX hydrolase [Candidatus Magasanikbacteria bacterium]|nr:NUDIX hydrolase [Candidatus Magasanikbacteria bacterium]